MLSKEQLLKLLASIITDNGRSFPAKVVSATVKDATRLEMYREFKAKLMLFWRGSHVDFVASGYPKRSANGATLYLPVDVKNKKDLYVKLIVATFNMDTRNHLYGGQ